MSRPQSQPLLRAPRPTHPLAPTEPAPPEPALAPAPPVSPPAARTPERVAPPSVAPVLPPADDEPALLEASTSPEGEQMRTFTTRLPVDLRRRLRRYAINTDRTLEQVARAMVTEYLDRHEADAP